MPNAAAAMKPCGQPLRWLAAPSSASMNSSALCSASSLMVMSVETGGSVRCMPGVPPEGAPEGALDGAPMKAGARPRCCRAALRRRSVDLHALLGKVLQRARVERDRRGAGLLVLELDVGRPFFPT